MAKNGKIEGNANLKKEAPGRDHFQPSQSSRAVKMSTPTMISRPKRRAIPSPDPYVFHGDLPRSAQLEKRESRCLIPSNRGFLRAFTQKRQSIAPQGSFSPQSEGMIFIFTKNPLVPVRWQIVTTNHSAKIPECKKPQN
jgi:hypothetical protein